MNSLLQFMTIPIHVALKNQLQDNNFRWELCLRACKHPGELWKQLLDWDRGLIQHSYILKFIFPLINYFLYQGILVSKLVSMSKIQVNTTYCGNTFHRLIIGFVNKIFLLSVLKINIYDEGIQPSKLIRYKFNGSPSRRQLDISHESSRLNS